LTLFLAKFATFPHSKVGEKFVLHFLSSFLMLTLAYLALSFCSPSLWVNSSLSSGRLHCIVLYKLTECTKVREVCGFDVWRLVKEKLWFIA